MIRRTLPILLILLLLIAVPVSGTAITRTWNQSAPSPALTGCLDANYVATTCPDFNTIEPWASMGRVRNDATQNQTMVRVKKFYYRVQNVTTSTGIHWMNFSISDVPATGYSLHPWFSVNGTIIPVQYIGAFEGSTYNVTTGTYVGDPASINITANIGDKLSSKEDQKPTSGLGKTTLTLPAFRTTAQNRGTGWELQSFNGVSAIQLMYLLEYGNWNSQSVIGAGVTQITDDAATNMAMPTGYTVPLGNATGQIATTHYQTGQYTYPMSYRGVENFYGNIWEWVDGLNIKANNKPWIADHDFASDLFAHPYIDTGLTLPSANGYVSNLAYAAGFDWAFLPLTVAGSSSTHITDYYYQTAGNRVACFGGSWAFGTDAGAFNWRHLNAASDTTRVIGSRLTFTPPLYANFTYTNTSNQYTFTDTSYNISTKTGLLTSPTSWNWSFGNGNISTLQNPTQPFSAGSTYTINLTVSDGTNYATKIHMLSDVMSIPTNTSNVTIPLYGFGYCLNQTGNITLSLNQSTPTSLTWQWSHNETLEAASLDGLFVPVDFDNSTPHLTQTGFEPETWHTLKIYNHTDFGRLSCMTNATPTPTPAPWRPEINPSVEKRCPWWHFGIWCEGYQK